jgi:hypothetical protein
METKCKTKRIYLLQLQKMAAISSGVSVGIAFAGNMYPTLLLLSFHGGKAVEA